VPETLLGWTRVAVIPDLVV